DETAHEDAHQDAHETADKGADETADEDAHGAPGESVATLSAGGEGNEIEATVDR
ncbi:MAG: hypothetical protein HY829_10970, partial [Actinobacteria bacterium]|nr:hypothetical protein [Actinomycetota bacterium]